MTVQASFVRTEWASDQELRESLRAFVRDNHPGRAPKDKQARLEWNRSWLATLFDGGFAGPALPRDYGGMQLTFSQQVVYHEEMSRARVPGPLGTGTTILAPILVRYATEEQRRKWLPSMLRADTIWAQGYSEPDAGSDLQSLRTTARRDGDEYVVNGSKIWNTHADISDMIFALVRTGPEGSRQAGISFLVLEAQQQGIHVAPLRDLTGGASFGQIFFEDARSHVSNLIGEENAGWALVKTSLGHERAAGAMRQATLYRRVLDELIELARERGRLHEAHVQSSLVDFEIRVQVMKHTAARIIDAILTKGEPGPASSVSRLAITVFEQELHEFAVDLLGMDGVVEKGDPRAVQSARWLMGYLRTRASTIGAGTAEIQRNTIAEQGLKLPHDPAMPPR